MMDDGSAHTALVEKGSVAKKSTQRSQQLGNGETSSFKVSWVTGQQF